MTYVRSYSHVERELMHHYRDQLNHAESEEDVKKFFAQTVQQLLRKVLDGGVTIEEYDVALAPEESPCYEVSKRLAGTSAFAELRRHSDIDAVIKRFAEPAMKHYRHLQRRPEKTESKIRHHS